MPDYKLVYKKEDGKEVIVKKNMFERLIHDDSTLGDLKFCPKVSEAHIQVQGHDRQRVRITGQLLSDTVSKELLVHTIMFEPRSNSGLLQPCK